LVLGALLLLPAGGNARAQCQRAKLTALDGAPEDLFGYSVAASAGVAAIGAVLADNQWQNSGAAYVFERLEAGWSPGLELTPDDGGGTFGRSVAGDEDIILVGASGAAKAYVFERSDESWSQTAELTANDGWLGDFFAWSVAVSGDLALVGAPEDDDNGAASGSAYVFERDPNGVWLQAAKLLAEDGQAGDSFGDAVAIDGDVAVIGAQDDDDLGNWSGSAYVFERDPNGAWLQTAKLLPHDGAGFWNFGISVAVSADLVLVGADGADGYTSRTGAAYVFGRDPNGVWVETAKLTAEYGCTFDAFGFSVALSGDVAVIGARWDHRETSGSAYVFVREAEGTWSQVDKLVPDDGAYGDEFGYSVGVSGNVAVIGAWLDDDHGEGSGSAYVFAVGPDEDGDGIMDVCLCPGDLDGDYDVDLADLAQLLAHYGTTNGAEYEDGDLDADGDVDLADLAALLAEYGTICP